MDMANRNRLLLAALLCVSLLLVVLQMSSSMSDMESHHHRTSWMHNHRYVGAEGGHPSVMNDAAPHLASAAMDGGSSRRMRRFYSRSGGGERGIAVQESQQGQTQRQQRARLVVSGAQIRADVPHGQLPHALRAARRIAEGVGGYISAEASQSNALPPTARIGQQGWTAPSQPGHAVLTIKVPVSRLDEAVALLGRIAKPTEIKRTAREVTAQVDDMELQLATARSELKRFDALYATTGSIQEKLQLMERLIQYQETVQRLDDARRRMMTMVDYATIALRLGERMPPPLQGYGNAPRWWTEHMYWAVGGVTTSCMGLGCLLKSVAAAVRLCFPWVRQIAGKVEELFHVATTQQRGQPAAADKQSD